MNKARVRTNLADLREDPRPDSRRSSQLLFNEVVEVIEERPDWRLVKGIDGYPGWTREVYLDDFRLDGDKAIVKSLQAPVFKQDGRLLTRLTFGTEVSGWPEDQYFRIDYPGGIVAKTELLNLELNGSNDISRTSFQGLALRFIGVPYLWGGSSSFGFDCSGLVQRLYGYYGIGLPRDSDQQKEQGVRIELGALDESKGVLQTGDLVFFEGHVGIYLEDGEMIHSSRYHNGVAITDLTAENSYVKHLQEIFLSVCRLPEFKEKGGQND